MKGRSLQRSSEKARRSVGTPPVHAVVVRSIKSAAVLISFPLETVLFRNLCVNLRDLLVRHTHGMPPRNPLIFLTLRKTPRFQAETFLFWDFLRLHLNQMFE
jgi:hypothetical protein